MSILPATASTQVAGVLQDMQADRVWPAGTIVGLLCVALLYAAGCIMCKMAPALTKQLLGVQ
jgi:hypothetical protein